METNVRESMLQSCLRIMRDYASIAKTCGKPATREEIGDVTRRYPDDVRKEAMKTFYQGS